MINILASLVPYVAVLLGMYTFQSAWLAVLLYHVGISGILLFRKPTGLWSRMWSGRNIPVLVSGLIICALAAPVVYFMWPWFATTENVLSAWLSYYGLTGWSWIFFVPYFSIVHPILEEVHWRGIDPQDSAVICRHDLLFAGYHVLVLFQLVKTPWLFLVFAILSGSSIFWRWTARHLGGYLVPIQTHAVADTGVVIAVCFLLRLN